jgi:hypothetical protein
METVDDTVVDEPAAITFGDNGVESGRLVFDDEGVMSFEGNADETARVFFDILTLHYNENTRKLLGMKKRIEGVIEWCESFPEDPGTPDILKTIYTRCANKFREAIDGYE